MYINILKVLDVQNAKNFEKIVYTIPLKNYQYHILLRLKTFTQIS